MTSNDSLASPLESDPDWRDFKSSAPKSYPPSDLQQLNPRSLSSVLPEGFVDGFGSASELGVVDESEAAPSAYNPSAVSSGPASQNWTLPQRGHKKGPRVRKEPKMCPTTSLTLITDQGTFKSYSPEKFNEVFHISGSESCTGPMLVVDSQPQCLAIPIPRPGGNVSEAGYKEVPRTREEFHRMFNHARELGSKIGSDKAFSVHDNDGWKRKDKWDTSA